MRRALLLAVGTSLLAGTGQLALSKDKPPQARVAARLSGYVHGLHPGGHRTMTVRVFNRRRFRVRVTSIHATRRRGPAGCPGRHLRVGRFPASRWDPRLHVSARRSRRVFLPVRLSPRAPDTCQHATFRVHLRARTTRAARP